MPRNMSFAMTTQQVIDENKTVTRRFGWWFLKVGDIVNACEKCMGLKKGEKVNKLKQIRVTGIRYEPLNMMVRDRRYGEKECKLEGFPYMEPDDFVQMLVDNYKCDPSKLVNRIEFEYL
jgi:hypothetical protein